MDVTPRNAVPHVATHVAPPAEHPEEILDAMAAGDDNLGARLLRMAREAAAFDRASILDLLADDACEPAPAPAEQPEVRVGPALRAEAIR